MRLTLVLIPLRFTLCSCSSKPEVEVNPFPEASETDVSSIAQGNNAFAIDLYKQLLNEKKPNENILISPYSINAALAMTYGGARGQTAAELAQVLHFELPSEELHPAQAVLSMWR